MLGEVVGNYRIVYKLAEGGMGEIYVAEHTRVGHRVAVKVLHPQFSQNPQILNRFFNEAKAATAIKHPGIVEFIDCGMHEQSGRAFIIKALLDGTDVRGRLKERGGRLGIDEAIHITVQVADVLSATHSRGVVHRDLKPDNIFLERDATGERVRLLDFGIAKLTGFQNVEQTFHGAVFGTPPYMSPEQCRAADEVDHRTDIYALGCVLFEMVCGRPPFPGENMDEVAFKHVNEPPPDPRLFASLPDELAAIILRLLEKAPRDRFQSMDEVKRALFAVTNPSARADAQASGRGDMKPVAVSRTPAPKEARVEYKRGAPIAAGFALAMSGLIAGLIVNASSGAKDEASEDGEPDAAVTRRADASVGPADARVASRDAAVTVDAGAIAAKVDAAPPPKPTITVTIRSTPKGARVLDAATGRELGKTPFTTTYPRGGTIAKLRLEHSGYHSHTLAPESTRDVTEEVTLRKRAPVARVSLRIISQPSRARVRVNGRSVGRAPLTTTIPAARATIVLTCPGHYTSRSVWRPGKSTRIRVELKARPDSPVGLDCE